MDDPIEAHKIDMASTVVVNSNQLNADDLIGGPLTAHITRVVGYDRDVQPIEIHYKGGEGKPYMACKSMRRVIIACWGVDASNYIGRSLTLYRDASVVFGDMAVGGIRISHASHISCKIDVALTVRRGKKKMFTIYPMPRPQESAPAPKTLAAEREPSPTPEAAPAETRASPPAQCAKTDLVALQAEILETANWVATEISVPLTDVLLKASTRTKNGFEVGATGIDEVMALHEGEPKLALYTYGRLKAEVERINRRVRMTI